MLVLLLQLLATRLACGDSSQERMRAPQIKSRSEMMHPDSSEWSEWPQNGNQESSNGPLVEQIRVMLKATESKISDMLAGIEERFMAVMMGGAPVAQEAIAPATVTEKPIERRKRLKASFFIFPVLS